MGATGALYFVGQGQWFAAALLFVLGTMGFNGGIVFNDSLLLDVAKPGELDRVSAFGYSLGYLGGGLLFLVNVLMVQQARRGSGLRMRAQAVQASFVTVAVWWLLFTIPLMRGVREQQRGPHLAFVDAMRVGFRELGATIAHMRQYRTIVMFLLAYWFYIDGVNTIIKMAVNYGMSLRPRHQQPAAPRCWSRSSWVFRRRCCSAGSAIASAPKRGILIGLVVYAGITVYAYFLDSARPSSSRWPSPWAWCRAACRACRARCSAAWCPRARTRSSSASTT